MNMQLWLMVTKQMKLMLANRIALLALFAAPLLLTYLFAFARDEYPITLYIADQDQSGYSHQLTSMLKEDGSFNVLILPENIMHEKIMEQDTAAGIVIEQGFESGAGEGTVPSHIKLVLPKSSAHQNVGQLIGAKLEAFLLHQAEPDQRLLSYKKAINSSEGSVRSRLDGFLLMFLWFAVIQGFRTLMDERENGLQRRLLMVPVRFAKYLLSKVISAYLVGISITFLVLIASTWFLDTTVWDHFGFDMAIWASYLLAITGLVMLLVPWIHSHQSFTVTGSVIMALAGILGGSFFPIEDSFPKWFRLISECVPGTWAMRALKDLSMGSYSLTSTLEVVGRLSGIGIVTIALSFLLMNYTLHKQKRNG
ncbi:ABC transporter permease [Paenibacillus sp. JJ-223]|uniref:ABC transporter permease n=1 Tax=Paenibacillus sp. JJ-223 TaxID=2905647 RepID=UPI001F449B15|nr:ABC transporter permease [Paenibacillus sp. JJ-223]CAH1191308.1 Linearmycin resistance permease protein LnrN [Paenibacillus sp. JJ-223]